jgi:hypothetical protein
MALSCCVDARSKQHTRFEFRMKEPSSAFWAQFLFRESCRAEIGENPSPCAPNSPRESTACVVKKPYNPVVSAVEAIVVLVPTTDFKSDEGAKAPWRVRFPSASATERLTTHDRSPRERLAQRCALGYSSRPMRGLSTSYMASISSPNLAITARRFTLSDGVSMPFSGVNSSGSSTKSRTRS